MCAAGILALAGRSLRPVEARDVVPPTTAPSTTTVSNGSSFIPSIGLTRTQVESLFREIDGSHTVFRAAPRCTAFLECWDRTTAYIRSSRSTAIPRSPTCRWSRYSKRPARQRLKTKSSTIRSPVAPSATRQRRIWSHQPDLEHDFTWAGHRNRGGGLRPGAHHCEDLSVHKILRTCGRDGKHRTYVNPPFMPLVRPCPPCGG